MALLAAGLQSYTEIKYKTVTLPTVVSVLLEFVIKAGIGPIILMFNAL